MNVIKYFERIKKIDTFLQRERTGNPVAFACQLEMKKSTLFALLRQMRIMGAKIGYDRKRETFYYIEKVFFIYGFLKNHGENYAVRSRIIYFDDRKKVKFPISSNNSERNGSGNGTLYIPALLRDRYDDESCNPMV